MSVSWLLLCYFIIVLSTEVRSQVCTEILQLNKLNKFTFSSIEKLCPHCERKVVTKTTQEYVPYTRLSSECCSGYTLKDKYLGASRENCVRSCELTCQNGKCSQNDCICNENYEKDPVRNTCEFKCDTGYVRRNGSCEPYCRSPCIGGRCVAPETCSCDSGWELDSVQLECVKIHHDCFPPCGNGTCMFGNICECRDGYEFNENTALQCVPSCQNSQGKCGHPDRYTEVSTVSSAENETENSKGHYKDNGAQNSDCNQSSIVYVLASANVIFIIIILLILMKYCKKSKTISSHFNNHDKNILERCDGNRSRMDAEGTQIPFIKPPLYETIHERTPNILDHNEAYMNMIGAQRPPLELPQTESIYKPSRAVEPLRYDYVQTPLPIHMRTIFIKPVRGGASRQVNSQ